mmetsp:Transcript_1586/g.2026  ORF Transcript_1586/g.2026 Transcript_1586/m.2026 type:complete len:245 (-) Transcript_1586:10-744(-)
MSDSKFTPSHASSRSIGTPKFWLCNRTAVFYSVLLLFVNVLRPTRSFSTQPLLSQTPHSTRSTAASSLSYTNTPDDKSNSAASPFENRMRDLMLKRQRKRNPTLSPGGKTRPSPNFFTANTLQEYKDIVADENNKMVVVRFFATWCKSCKAIAPHYYRLARQHPDIKFVDVAVTEKNSELHQGLGVPSVPFAHIYHPDAGLVEEFKISKKYFWMLNRTVNEYEGGKCDLIDGVDNPYGQTAKSL